MDSYTEKAEATDVVGGTVGVTAIDNRIEVRMPAPPFLAGPHALPQRSHLLDLPDVHTWDAPPKRDEALEAAVAEELAWNPFVDAHQVSVIVVGSAVTLEGAVDSWIEHDAAARSALRAGASAVRNDLLVK